MSEAPWPFGFPLTPVEEASRLMWVGWPQRMATGTSNGLTYGSWILLICYGTVMELRIEQKLRLVDLLWLCWTGLWRDHSFGNLTQCWFRGNDTEEDLEFESEDEDDEAEAQLPWEEQWNWSQWNWYQNWSWNEEDYTDYTWEKDSDEEKCESWQSDWRLKRKHWWWWTTVWGPCVGPP